MRRRDIDLTELKNHKALKKRKEDGYELVFTYHLLYKVLSKNNTITLYHTPTTTHQYGDFRGLSDKIFRSIPRNIKMHYRFINIIMFIDYIVDECEGENGSWCTTRQSNNFKIMTDTDPKLLQTLEHIKFLKEI